MAEAQEKLRLQSKELKDAIGQRKLAMTEYTEVSDKYVHLKHSESSKSSSKNPINFQKKSQKISNKSPKNPKLNEQ